MQKTFSIKTLGCKLNQYETSLMAGQFLENGWVSRPFGESVDLVIINTCTVTNKSDKKCRNYIRQGALYSKNGKVLVTGCLADRDTELVAGMPEVFAIVKNSDKETIHSTINNYYNNLFSHDEEQVNNINIGDDIGFEKFEKFDKKEEYPLPFYRTRGLVKIQDGCDGQCSYCIVPSVRGLPVSRDFNEVLNHAHKLIDAGCPKSPGSDKRDN
jgi:threonylcarbamoyladenosine tRNA methylthiotransferase MtaB